jgi:uncharacterized protein DUF3237
MVPAASRTTLLGDDHRARQAQMLDLEYEMTLAERIEGPLGHQDQRSSFRTADRALILTRYDVALIRGERFAQALERGQETSFSDQYICRAPQFEVGSEDYAWLTRSLFAGRGRLAGPRRIEYEIYRVAG